MRMAVGGVALFCLLTIVSACQSAQVAEMKALDASASAGAVQPQRLQVGDKVHVVVFGEDAISGAYDVDETGSLTLPLAGTVKSSGLTTAGLEEVITQSLKRRFLRDPKVTVDVVSLRPFYILGEVEKPGEYAYRNGLDIWRAMALAGGQTYRASSSTVAIQRAGESQWHDYELADAPGIQPGDVIRVPQRWF